MEATERVKRLFEMVQRSPMVQGKLNYAYPGRQRYLFLKGWIENRQVYSVRLRRAYADAYVLEHMNPVIHPDELLVGTPEQQPLTPEEEAQMQGLRWVEESLQRYNGRRGHMTLDWAKLLRLGVCGLMDEIRERRAALDLEKNENLSRDEFYEGCLVELEALLKLAARYARAAREMGREDVADILERVPAYPARTFREALQSIHFYVFSLWDLYFFGRVDQFLLEYYERDLAAGRITEQEAQELVDCLMLLSAEYIGPDSVQVCTIGGRDPEGRPVDNALTRIFLQSCSHAPVQPAQVALLVRGDTPHETLRFALEQLATGCSQPQLYNDDVITQSMRDWGFPEAQSHDYGNCGCVEIVPCACSGIFTVSPYHNLVAMLLEAMRTLPGDFETLKSRFVEIVRREVRRENLRERRDQMERARNGNECLRASCLVNDCLARGMSVDEGGARYNHIQPNFLGLSNTVDGLAAVNRLVYESGEYDMPRLLEILDSNFEKEPSLRARIIHRLPHFGTNEPETDALMKWLGEELVAACRGLTAYRNEDPCIPGAFSYKEHSRHGSRTGASPDGRLSGTALAAGSGAVQGRETAGPTAALCSDLAWDQRLFLGGIANNLMFSRKQMSGESLDKLYDLVRSFFDQGGMQLQINLIDRETLLRAQQEPEKYQNLLVRVGGFNARFVACEPELQQEIIERNEHIL